jgi:hypothetical protein
MANAASEMPKSTFTIPRSPDEGRDPFFPNSARLFAAVASKAITLPVATTSAELLLKGFSGPSNQRLAIINNRTFSSGESGEVRTSNSRVRVRCVQINEDSVIIETNGERRVLRLRNGV